VEKNEKNAEKALISEHFSFFGSFFFFNVVWFAYGYVGVW